MRRTRIFVALMPLLLAMQLAYLGARTPGVRRLFLSRVGYFIYYVADAADLGVLAFWHASREHQPVV